MIYSNSKRNTLWIRLILVAIIFCAGVTALWFNRGLSSIASTEVGSKELSRTTTNAPKSSQDQTHGIVFDEPFKEWATGAWETNFFENGVRFAKESNAQSRALALEKLFSQRRSLSNEQLMKLKQILKDNIRATSDDPYVVAKSIHLLAGLLDYLKSKGVTSDAEIAAEGELLVQYMRNSTLDLQVRGASIRFIGDLGILNGRAAIEELLSDSANVNTPELARNGCLALVKLTTRESLPLVRTVFEKTSDPSVFGTAAFCLGQVNTAEAMSALVGNSHRFPDSASCDAALAKMDNVILETLNHPNDPRVIDAIQATEHLWKEGQRDKWVSSLRGLLTSSPLEVRKAACERLIEAASHVPFTQEKQELSVALESVAQSPELGDYAERIRQRMSATILLPGTGSSSVPTPKRL